MAQHVLVSKSRIAYQQFFLSHFHNLFDILPSTPIPYTYSLSIIYIIIPCLFTFLSTLFYFSGKYAKMSIMGPTFGPLPAYGSVYDSLEQLIESCKLHAIVNGYALVIDSKKPNATNPIRVVLRCSRGRSYRPDKRSEKMSDF